MRFLVLANTTNYNEFTKCSDAVNWQRLDSLHAYPAGEVPDAVFVLDDIEPLSLRNIISIPVFINSVSITLKELSAPPNVIRFNGWPHFIANKKWEISGTVNAVAASVLSSIGKECISTKDEPGFLSARIVAMIINEAYFAKGENVSTAAEIDTAMKFGTNYPYGPFEWADIIGLDKVAELLKKLALTDSRYALAPALLEKIQL